MDVEGSGGVGEGREMREDEGGEGGVDVYGLESVMGGECGSG